MECVKRKYLVCAFGVSQKSSFVECVGKDCIHRCGCLTDEILLLGSLGGYSLFIGLDGRDVPLRRMGRQLHIVAQDWLVLKPSLSSGFRGLVFLCSSRSTRILLLSLEGPEVFGCSMGDLGRS